MNRSFLMALLLSIFWIAGSTVWAAPQVGQVASAESSTASDFSAEGRGYFGFTSHYEDGPTASSGHIRILEVYPDSPAERAGLRVDDVIRTVNGESFRFRHDFDMIQSFGRFGSGTTVRLGVLRREQHLDLKLHTTPLPAKRAEALEAWLASAHEWYEGGGCDTCETRQAKAESRQSTIDLMFSRDLTLTIRRDSSSRELLITAEEVDLPLDVDAAELPMVGPMAAQLKPGDHLILRLTQDLENQRIQVEPLHLPDYIDQPKR